MPCSPDSTSAARVDRRVSGDPSIFSKERDDIDDLIEEDLAAVRSLRTDKQELCAALREVLMSGLRDELCGAVREEIFKCRLLVEQRLTPPAPPEVRRGQHDAPTVPIAPWPSLNSKEEIDAIVNKPYQAKSLTFSDDMSRHLEQLPIGREDSDHMSLTPSLASKAAVPRREEDEWTQCDGEPRRRAKMIGAMRKQEQQQQQQQRKQERISKGPRRQHVNLHDLQQELASELFQAWDLIPPKENKEASNSRAKAYNRTSSTSSMGAVGTCSTSQSFNWRNLGRTKVVVREPAPDIQEAKCWVEPDCPISVIPATPPSTMWQGSGSTDAGSTEVCTLPIPGCGDEVGRPPSQQEYRRVPTFQELKKRQDKELTNTIDTNIEDFNLSQRRSLSKEHWIWWPNASQLFDFLVPAVGVLPWNERWPSLSMVYQWAFFFLALLGVAVSVAGVHLSWSGPGLALVLHVQNSVLTIGALLGLLACSTLRKSSKLIEAQKLLLSHCFNMGVVVSSGEIPLTDYLVTFGCWFAGVVWTFLGTVLQKSLLEQDLLGVRLASHILFFALSSAVLMGICQHVKGTCAYLTRLIDNFCFRTIEEADFRASLREWNLLQALCRACCSSIELAFTALQLTATALVLLNVSQVVNMDFNRFLASTPTLLTAFLVFRTSIWAAAVTDKCLRVPMLVNSVSVGNDLDPERLYAVQYIERCQAGFYLFELRLTSETVLKMTYVACAGCFFLAARFL